jgi:hypothetical protein
MAGQGAWSNTLQGHRRPDRRDADGQRPARHGRHPLPRRLRQRGRADRHRPRDARRRLRARGPGRAAGRDGRPWPRRNVPGGRRRQPRAVGAVAVPRRRVLADGRARGRRLPPRAWPR